MFQIALKRRSCGSRLTSHYVVLCGPCEHSEPTLQLFCAPQPLESLSGLLLLELSANRMHVEDDRGGSSVQAIQPVGDFILSDRGGYTVTKLLADQTNPVWWISLIFVDVGLALYMTKEIVTQFSNK